MAGVQMIITVIKIMPPTTSTHIHKKTHPVDCGRLAEFSPSAGYKTHKDYDYISKAHPRVFDKVLWRTTWPSAMIKFGPHCKI